jgi:hypothetical protein
MKAISGLITLVWWLVGLAMLIRDSYIFAAVVGIIIPVVPMFYAVYCFVLKFLT